MKYNQNLRGRVFWHPANSQIQATTLFEPDKSQLLFAWTIREPPPSRSLYWVWVDSLAKCFWICRCLCKCLCVWYGCEKAHSWNRVLDAEGHSSDCWSYVLYCRPTSCNIKEYCRSEARSSNLSVYSQREIIETEEPYKAKPPFLSESHHGE